MDAYDGYEGSELVYGLTNSDRGVCDDGLGVE